MAFAETSGTATAVVGTPNVLATGQTTDEVLQLIVNMVNMVAGDFVEFRLKDKVVAAGAVVTLEVQERAHAQASAFVWDLPLIGLHAWAVELLLTASAGGTNRSFEWSIRRAA